MSTVLQLSDLHLWEDEHKIYHGRSPFKQLNAAIQEVNAHVDKDKIIILSGDLTSYPTPKAYQLLASMLRQVQAPIYVMAGNHDDRQMMDTYLLGENISHDTVIQLNGWLIILLDSSSRGKNLGSGKLEDAELNRLESTLTLYPKMNTLIFIHHPPILFGAAWFQTVCLDPNEKFDAIINNNQQIKAIIFGHAHTQYTTVKNNKLYICAPSTWRQFDHTVNEDSVYNAMLGGYNWYQLHAADHFAFGTNYFP